MAPALLLVDLQRDFFFSTGLGRLSRAICLPGVYQLITYARSSGWSIVHAVTRHQSEETLPSALRRSGTEVYCLEGERGSELLEGVREPEEPLIIKRGYSAFQGTNGAELLAGHAQLVVAGINADCCILHTAFDAGTLWDKEIYLPFQAIGAGLFDNFAHPLRIMGKTVAAVVDLRDLLSGTDLSWDLRIEPERILTVLEVYRPLFELAAGLPGQESSFPETIQAFQRELQVRGLL